MTVQQVVRTIKDPRVIWMPGERSGRPSVPRNRGIRSSRGEWIAFLDDDDVWLPEKLERQAAALKASGCLACCTNALRFIPGREGDGPYLMETNNVVTFDDLLKANQIICSSAMLHRSLFQLVVGFPENALLKALEDYALWLRVAT